MSNRVILEGYRLLPTTAAVAVNSTVFTAAELCSLTGNPSGRDVKFKSMNVQISPINYPAAMNTAQQMFTAHLEIFDVASGNYYVATGSKVLSTSLPTTLSCSVPNHVSRWLGMNSATQVLVVTIFNAYAGSALPITCTLRIRAVAELSHTYGGPI